MAHTFTEPVVTEMPDGTARVALPSVRQELQERESLRTATVDRVTSWDIGDTLQPVKANRTSRGPDEMIQQSPVDGSVPKQASPLNSEDIEQCLPNTVVIRPKPE